MYRRALYADGQYARAAGICIDGMARQPFVATALTCMATVEQLGHHEEAVALARTAASMALQLTVSHALSSWGFREERLNRQFEGDLRAAGLSG